MFNWQRRAVKTKIARILLTEVGPVVQTRKEPMESGGEDTMQIGDPPGEKWKTNDKGEGWETKDYWKSRNLRGEQDTVL
jgi:hypothetical protein